MATIKKGTYRWNDVLNIPEFEMCVDVSFCLSPAHTLNYETKEVVVLGGHGTTYDGLYWDDVQLVYADDDGLDIYLYYSPDTSLSNRWTYGEYLTSGGYTGVEEVAHYGQTITILEDTEVSTEFAEWFSENTKPVIKAGTYRFNDTISFDGVDAFWQDIAFTVKGVLIYDAVTGTVSFDIYKEVSYVNLTVIEEGDDDRIVFNPEVFPEWQPDNTIRVEPDTVYNNSAKWDDFYHYCKDLNNIDLPSLKGYGQTITLETDQTVETDFYEWFVANAKSIIKKGIYRFADTITRPLFAEEVLLPTSVNMVIPAEVIPQLNEALISEGMEAIEVQDYFISASYSAWEVLQGIFPAWADGGFSLINLLRVSYDISPYEEIFELINPLSGSEIYHSMHATNPNEVGEYSPFNITEDTAVSSEFATWFNDNTKPVIKKFTRLYIGNTVALSGGKCFKRLTTEVPYTVSGTWVFNEHPTTPDPKYLYSEVKFVSNGKTYFLMGRTWLSNSDELRYAYYSDTEEGYLVDKVYEQGVDPEYYINGWADEAYRTVTFIGEQNMYGEFYEWFTKNAKPSITDLTGTTWYVPSGWSATAGYGDFEIIGEFIRPTYSYEIEKFGIGYATSQASADKLRLKRPEIATPSSFLKVDGEFTLKITGGTDVTNPDLISWLETYGTMQ